jgi:hypothetical protein
MLDRGVVRFSFRKRDGSVRNALGTRNTNLIPKTENVLDVEDISSKSIVYWDLESRGYRSLQSNARTEVLEQ